MGKLKVGQVLEEEEQVSGYLNLKLIGKLLRGKLDMSRLHSTWKLSGYVHVLEQRNNFYVFDFSEVDDFSRVWSQGPLFMGKQCLVMKRWHPDFSAESESMAFSQIWVRFPKLPCEYWDPQFLYEMGSVAGQPIKIAVYEEISGEQSIRMCVEVDLNSRLPTGNRIDGVEGGLFQNFQYEIPSLCFTCGRVGHEAKVCSMKPFIIHTKDGRSMSYSAYGSWVLAPIEGGVKQPSSRPVSLRYIAWTRPSSQWTKLNFDGSAKGGTGKAGAGGLLRDADGSFIGAFVTPLPINTSPLVAEASALYDGLRLAVKLHVECILIEGDSKLVIEMLNGLQKPCYEEISSLIISCQNLLKHFTGVVAHHEYREANHAADHLANMAVEAVHHEEWNEDPPDSLIPILEDDLMGRLVPRLIL